MAKSGDLRVVQITVMSLIAIISCFLNTVLIYIVSKRKKLSSRMNYLLISLAISDLLFGGISIPLHLISDSQILRQGQYACLLVNSFQMPLSLVSLLLLIMMALDRLIAITYPLIYISLVTPRRLVMAIGMIWIYGLICALLPITGWNNFDVSDFNESLYDCNFAYIMDGNYIGFYALGHFIPGGVVMLALYLKIFLSTRAHNRTIGTSEELNLPRDIALKLATARKHRTTSKIIVTLGSVFLISYLPLFTALAIDYQVFTQRVIRVWIAPYELYLVGSFLASLNPIINPLILGFTKRNLRIHVLQFFKRNNSVHVQVPNVSSAADVTWKPEMSRVPVSDISASGQTLEPRAYTRAHNCKLENPSDYAAKKNDCLKITPQP